MTKQRFSKAQEVIIPPHDPAQAPVWDSFVTSGTDPAMHGLVLCGSSLMVEGVKLIAGEDPAQSAEYLEWFQSETLLTPLEKVSPRDSLLSWDLINFIHTTVGDEDRLIQGYEKIQRGASLAVVAKLAGSLATSDSAGNNIRPGELQVVSTEAIGTKTAGELLEYAGPIGKFALRVDNDQKTGQVNIIRLAAIPENDEATLFLNINHQPASKTWKNHTVRLESGTLIDGLYPDTTKSRGLEVLPGYAKLMRKLFDV